MFVRFLLDRDNPDGAIVGNVARDVFLGNIMGNGIGIGGSTCGCVGDDVITANAAVAVAVGRCWVDDVLLQSCKNKLSIAPTKNGIEDNATNRGQSNTFGNPTTQRRHNSFG